MCAAQIGPREEQLLQEIKSSLDVKNYTDAPPAFRGGAASTHSLKELLISSSVAMEANYDTNVTALSTIDCEPAEIVENFERLLSFTEDTRNGYKSELVQVVFPVFVHIYLDFVARGLSDTALNFYNKHFSSVGSLHKPEMKDLSEIITAEQLSASQLANRYRNQKYCMRMSNQAFQLLVQFLQVCSSPALLNLIQRNLAIEVYGNTVVNGGDPKSDQKKGATGLTFTKPNIPLLHDSQPMKKKNTFITGVGSSDSWSGSGKHKMRQKQPNVSSAHAARLTEFRDKLAMASQLDPCAPSVALYVVHSNSVRVHCASLAVPSKILCCGFADSTIHAWSQLPRETDHVMPSHVPSGSGPMRLHPGKESPDHRVLRGHYGPVYSTCCNTTGQFAVSGSEDCSVRLWDVNKSHALVCYRGHSYPVWDVTFSPVDVYFASASYDHTARLWTTDLTYPLRILAGHTASVDVVQFHPNGKYIATGSSDRTCRLWDVQSGQCMRLMTGIKSRVTSLAFSPNGKHLTSGDEEGTIQLWDIGSGAVLKELPCSGDPVSTLTYSPDGLILASGCHDNQLRLWNMRNAAAGSSDVIAVHRTPGMLILNLQFTHRNCVTAMAMTAEGPSPSTAHTS